MKTYKSIIIILILLLLPTYSYASNLGQMYISLIQGDVQIKTDDTLDWVVASINMPLKEGDMLWVPEAGRLEIKSQDGTCVRLDENSGIELLTVEEASNQFYLSFGRAYVNFRGLRDGLLQMDTPLSSLRVYDNSKFTIDVSDSGYTELSVITGAVYAESRSGQTRVSAGKTLSIGEDLYAEISPLGPSDEWERWNRERDSTLYERRHSDQYLPSELQSYSYDFDHYGRWVNTTDYGYVWTPTFAISIGWAPYSVGRWVWIGGDYIWISYEPWGWVPYHYGRWSWFASFGWGWVPPIGGACYWGPGYVGWAYAPRYVAWVPLAPGEIYYGYGYYGPHSINIYNTNINNINIYGRHRRNALIHNGVSIVNRDNFLNGRYKHLRLKENPFLRKASTVGRPQIKPERATKLPVLKDNPLTKQPPQLVRNLDVNKLKKDRPLVRAKKNSVLSPESLTKNMPVRTVKKTSTLLAKRGTEKGSYFQQQRQVNEKQRGLTSSTQEKQRTSKRSSTEKQKVEGKKSPYTSSLQKPKDRDSNRKDSQGKISGKQPDVMKGKTLQKYQPSSKQNRSDTSIIRRYTPVEPSVKSQSGKKKDYSGSRSSLQGPKRQEPQKAYSSLKSSKTPTSRQKGKTTQLTQRQSSGSYRSVTPPSSKSQKSYVSRGNNSSKYTQHSRNYVNRGRTSSSSGWWSRSGYRTQPHAGFSRNSSRASSMGSSRASSMGSSRALSMGSSRAGLSRSPSMRFGRK